MLLRVTSAPRVTVLAGGVGGAKLAHGVAMSGSPLAVVVNTADDAEIYGLSISPDLDTVMYTLAGIADTETGWGVRGETYTALEAMRRLGEDTWFTLGDRDLATHITRSSRLRRGVPLSTVTAELAAALGVRASLLPMTDQPVATIIETPDGQLSFQDYFVRRRHQDEVRGIAFEGIEAARPGPGVVAALTEADVVLIAPSNPLVSVGPVLAVPGLRSTLAGSPARRAAVSPVVGGQALKGPAAAMLRTLGHEVSALGVARLYQGLVDVMCIDDRDAHLAPAIEELGMRVAVTDTVMADDPGRERLARYLVATAMS